MRILHPPLFRIQGKTRKVGAQGEGEEEEEDEEEEEEGFREEG